MKKMFLFIAFMFISVFPNLAIARPSNTWVNEGYSEIPVQTLNVTRFWSNTYRGHFYTANAAEAAYVDANYPDNVWSNEGTAFTVWNTAWCDLAAPPPGICVPVYRFWSETYKHHFYTISATERDNVAANMPEWRYEGVVYSADSAAWWPASAPLYRFWSDTYKSHFYTTNVTEKNNIQMNMPEWTYEGVAYYAIDGSLIPPA